MKKRNKDVVAIFVEWFVYQYQSMVLETDITHSHYRCVMRHSFYDTHTLHIAHIVLLTDKGKKSILDLSKRGKLKFNFGWADKKPRKRGLTTESQDVSHHASVKYRCP